MSDGAGIHLTKVWGADRTGHLYYDAPLLPDYPITIDWARLGTTDDPVLQAAIQWLQMEEGCG